MCGEIAGFIPGRPENVLESMLLDGTPRLGSLNGGFNLEDCPGSSSLSSSMYTLDPRLWPFMRLTSAVHSILL